MLNEISYGVIPLKKKDKWQVFLVQLKSGNHWGFPKGHLNKSEKTTEVAKRELKEETNLEIVKYISDKIFEEHYNFEKDGKKISKKVCYCLAEVKGKIKLPKDEILDGGWFELKDAYEKITFKESKRICHQIELFLKTLV